MRRPRESADRRQKTARERNGVTLIQTDAKLNLGTSEHTCRRSDHALDAAIAALTARAAWQGLATRPDADESTPLVKKYVSWGAGPRASQYLILGAKARAAMDGRAVPDLEDVNAMAVPVLSHRVVVNFQAEAEGMSPTRLVTVPARP